jgi:uncharacterized SAM-binding protein YcdF (DUF218 family)
MSRRLNSPSSHGSRQKWFGLLRRKESWSLTWRGWLALLCLLSILGVLCVRNAHGFLAVDAPVSTRVLVLEGWVPRYAATGYVARVAGDYDKIYTTGGVTLADRKSRDDSDTFASVAQTRLVRAGVPAAKIQYVPAWKVKRDRTYASALALREWCASNRVELTAFNLVTLGPHARRSRLLYQKAFPDAKVGIIPLTNEEYDADHWWRYSEGVKETLSESMAYLYSRFLFSPD